MAHPEVKNVILGTAGHIDHGKSSLVKALTGVDPDRLKEEKERGITIDLGFANLSYPDGLTVGIVDVPGHEKLIKNMLAGAGGIDLVLMIIAADEGIMPQSREHLAICELLRIKAGLVAVTKSDLVDRDWLQLVSDDVKEFVRGTFLEGAPIIPVSARTGENTDLLKEKIREISLSVQPKLINASFRLPIDRVFTLKGFGTVVTGTAVSGTISIDSQVEILPSGITSKVRGLQTHGRAVERAFAGQRTGINLQGIDKDSLRRGDVVVSPGKFMPSKAIDAKLDLLSGAPAVKTRSRVHFYSGTSETIARVLLYDREELKERESCYCQFRLEEPVVTLAGDRYIIRRFSPLETIGGGEILDPQPLRRRRDSSPEDLAALEKGSLQDKIETKVRRNRYRGCTLQEIEGWILADIQKIQGAVDSLVHKGSLVRTPGGIFHKNTLAEVGSAMTAMLRTFHAENPLKQGIPKEEIKAMLTARLHTDDRILSLVPLVDEIVLDQDLLRHRDFRISLSRTEEGSREKIVSLIHQGGFQPPFKEDLADQLKLNEKEVNDLLKLLSREGLLVRVNDSMYITRERHEDLMNLLRAFFSKKPVMAVAEFRDLLGTTRKFALPLLEYLDTQKITLRVGDIRKFMVK